MMSRGLKIVKMALKNIAKFEQANKDDWCILG